jgi:hypothetical protein
MSYTRKFHEETKVKKNDTKKLKAHLAGFTGLTYGLFRDIAVPGIACPTSVNNVN